MYIVLLLAALAIIGGVVAVAMGWGGEIASFAKDRPPFALRIRTPSDVAMLRLPVGLFGYQEQATGEALRAAARLLEQRDEEITRLREELWSLHFPASEGAPGGCDPEGNTRSRRTGAFPAYSVGEPVPGAGAWVAGDGSPGPGPSGSALAGADPEGLAGADADVLPGEDANGLAGADADGLAGADADGLPGTSETSAGDHARSDR